MIHEIRHDEQLLAILIPGDHHFQGIQFITPNELSQQLAYMQYGAGKVIAAHVHNPVPRAVTFTRETLFVRKGKVRMDLYTDDHQYIKSYLLGTGDVVLLVSGGHGFEILEPTEMIEVKQGPYPGVEDKTVFATVDSTKISFEATEVKISPKAL